MNLPHPSVPSNDTYPRAFGSYRLLRRIARGGMADIYLATSETELGIERTVVVKQMLEDLSGDAGFSKMFVTEAKLAAQLRHANIVQVFDLGRESDRLYIAMEYVEGLDLNRLLRRLSVARIPLPSEFALLTVIEVLRALDYAHRARSDAGEPMGIVHRDVSPSNVLLSMEGEVKLCDFGIARAYGMKQEMSEESVRTLLRSQIAGKSAYMAPEQARGEGTDSRADIFGAGIILWELCAGRRLYKGTNEQMLALAREANIPPLPDRGFVAQERLQGVIDRALTKDRDARWQTAHDMLQALEYYAQEVKLLTSPLRFSAFLRESVGEAPTAQAEAPSMFPPPESQVAIDVQIASRIEDQETQRFPSEIVSPSYNRPLRSNPTSDRRQMRRWVFVVAALVALSLLVWGFVARR